MSDLMSGWFFRLTNGHGVTLFRSSRTYQTMEHAGWLAYMTWKMGFSNSYPDATLEVDYTKDYLAEMLDLLHDTGALP